MPVTFKRQDNLEKMLEEFASFDQLDSLIGQSKEKKKEEAEASDA